MRVAFRSTIGVLLAASPFMASPLAAQTLQDPEVQHRRRRRIRLSDRRPDRAACSSRAARTSWSSTARPAKSSATSRTRRAFTASRSRRTGPRLHDERRRLDVDDVRSEDARGEEEDQGGQGRSRRHHVRRRHRQDPHDRSQQAARHRGRHRSRRRRTSSRRSPLTGDGPEGGVSDGKGRIYINLEDKNAIDVVDTKTWKVVDDLEDRPVRWSDRHRDGPRDESHLLRLQQDSRSSSTPPPARSSPRLRTATVSTRSAGISRRS